MHVTVRPSSALRTRIKSFTPRAQRTNRASQSGRRFEFEASADLIAWDCNCSICAMKKNTHVVVPERSFKITQGEDQLQEYRFGSKTARHLFCKHATNHVQREKTVWSGCPICPTHLLCCLQDLRGDSILRSKIQPGWIRHYCRLHQARHDAVHHGQAVRWNQLGENHTDFCHHRDVKISI